MASDYETVLCVKNKVFVYRIPPRPSNRGYRAADWKLDTPDWTGRLRVVAKGKDLFIKLEDKTSGELFAQCPVKEYPGIAVESVMDSSRYFVLRIQDDNGRSASIGIGFEDRGDSFDLNVSLQDHFKWLKTEEEAKQGVTKFDTGPKLDLGFKEGQTITINIGTKKTDSGAKSRPRASGGGGGGIGILPPPPGGVKLPAPPSGATVQQSFFDNKEEASAKNDSSAVNSSSASNSNVDFLLDFESDFTSSTVPAIQPQTVQQPQQSSSDPWGDFASASSQPDSSGDGWVQF